VILDSTQLRFGDTIAPNTDLGVEKETSLSRQQMSALLGFNNAMPFQFNEYRHKNGILPWDDPKAFEDADSPDLQKIMLHWHQLFAVHAIVRNVFTVEPVERTPGLLIADEVGLGKTAMAIAIVRQITHPTSEEKRRYQITLTLYSHLARSLLNGSMS